MVVTDGVVRILGEFLLTHDTLVDKGYDSFPRFFFGVTSLCCFQSYPKSCGEISFEFIFVFVSGFRGSVFVCFIFVYALGERVL